MDFDPSGGEVRLTSSRDETVAQLVLRPAGSRPTSPGGKRRLIQGEGSTARISNGLRTQNPGGGEVRLTSSRDETVVCFS